MSGGGVLHSELTLHQTPDSITVAAKGAPHSLSINTNTLEVGVGPATVASPGRQICGIIGIINLPLSQYLILITEKTEIGPIDGQNIVWKMAKYELVPFHESRSAPESVKQLNETYLGLVHKALTGKSFYFSYTYDLSHTMQRLANVDESFGNLTYIERADERFVWNRYLLAQIEVCPELSGFALPLIFGVLSITTCSLFGKTFEFILFSRRNWNRIGVRYFCRGADDSGNVANNVETEQIVRFNGQIASHVNTRGSIPLFWSQRSNITYKPYVKLFNKEHQKDVFIRHMQQQIGLYGKNIIVSLIDNKGKEKEICQSFNYIAGQNLLPGVKFIHFDFHKECSKMQWHKLNLLIDQIRDDLDKYGYYFKDSQGQVSSTQSGVVRTNCIDCLDRTNVVQGLIARYILTKQLVQMGVVEEGGQIPATSQFEYVFKNRWADNGDGIAYQYTGTPALKSDYTRTGVRTRGGLLHDGYKSMQRYVQNNFLDGARQDSYDLIVGNHRYSGSEESPLAKAKHPVGIFLPAIIGVFIALLIMKLVMPEETWMSQLSHIALYMAVIAFLLKQCISWGDHLVDQPRLCHTLAKAKAE